MHGLVLYHYNVQYYFNKNIPMVGTIFLKNRGYSHNILYCYLKCNKMLFKNRHVLFHMVL